MSSFQKCFISNNKKSSDTIWFNLHYLFLCNFVFECGALADIVMSLFSNSIGYEDFLAYLAEYYAFKCIRPNLIRSIIKTAENLHNPRHKSFPFIDRIIAVNEDEAKDLAQYYLKKKRTMSHSHSSWKVKCATEKSTSFVLKRFNHVQNDMQNMDVVSFLDDERHFSCQLYVVITNLSLSQFNLSHEKVRIIEGCNNLAPRIKY